ncbi:MAG: YbaY family lipoprotein [Planctomycetota bacterium]
MRSFPLWQVAILGVIVCSRHALLAQSQPPERDRAIEGAERNRERGHGEQPGWDRGDHDSSWNEQRLVPGSPDQEGRWYLGVEVEYRDHGAEVTHAERGSPARRAGLEPRDVIVTVDGYQVGRVNGRMYTLDRELELRADRQGRVTLLVQDRRARRLVSVPVRLEPDERRRDPIRSESIIGTIRSARFTAVPRRGLLTVRLLDVTDQRRSDQVRPDERRPGQRRPDQQHPDERRPDERRPDQVVAERTYRDLGPSPFPFELMYERDEIEREREYALEAEISVNGDTELRTPEPYPVLTREEQGRVHMVLEPVR